MEAVGFVASVAQLADLAVKVFGDLHRYYHGVKNAPVRAKELREELGGILRVVETLKDVLSDTPSKIGISSETLVGVVDQFTETLLDMEKQVDAERAKGIRRMKWPFNEHEIQEVIDKIERFKNTFNLALNLEQT
jgi:Fungal N-terminal domain of STAND proteins